MEAISDALDDETWHFVRNAGQKGRRAVHIADVGTEPVQGLRYSGVFEDEFVARGTSSKAESGVFFEFLDDELGSGDKAIAELGIAPWVVMAKGKRNVEVVVDDSLDDAGQRMSEVGIEAMGHAKIEDEVDCEIIDEELGRGRCGDFADGAMDEIDAEIPGFVIRGIVAGFDFSFVDWPRWAENSVDGNEFFADYDTYVHA